jgi:hypothetical protein
MKVQKSIIFLFLSLTLFTSSKTATANSNSKPRIIITADPELDDNNSLIRFLLYSADFNIEGLVYASSQFHWKGDGKGTKFMVPGREYTKYGLNLCPCESYRWKKGERFIHEAVEAYEKVYQNLVIHNKSYPSPNYLKSKIKYGNIEFEGDFSKDTEGSNLIKKIILDTIAGPIYITAWGGQSTIARALKSIEDEFKNSKNWNIIKQKISKKVVLLPSGDQDNTYASYIKPNWPDIDYRQYKNGPNYGYGAQLSANAQNAPLLTADWMQKNISLTGALGDIYRVWGDGKQTVKDDRFDYFGLDGYTNEQLKQMGYIVWMPKQPKGSWLGEGDTGTFMNLLNNGLNAIKKDNPGGWGGRSFNPNPRTFVDPFSNDTSKVKELVISASTYNKMSEVDENEAAFPDFFSAAQNDFAARMNWTIKNNYKLANHAPIIRLLKKNELIVKPGQMINLEAIVNDPDGDAYSIKWWQFFKQKNTAQIGVSYNNSLFTTIEIPKDAKAQQKIYLVLEVADKTAISITSYKMIKITIN